MTVGRTYVTEILKRHWLDLLRLRRHLKHRRPPDIPLNQVWGVDLTGKTNDTRQLHPILAVVEHGSRVALCLAALLNKAAWTLVGYLCLTIGRFGKPRFVRSDNEATFTGKVMRQFLQMAHIGHQRIPLVSHGAMGGWNGSLAP
ncbi:hypothetical protein [Chitinivorax sp. B]|uniref:hypothetical protein n=1 Tax=Chitinivorax sp. B TaxID=2502235 RepID=UPI0014856916|nr:hypothetical protein [Chitinivorax sp. B]